MAAVTPTDPVLAGQLAALEDAAREAKSFEKVLENTVEAEARNAADTVRARYKDQLAAAYKTRCETEAAVADFISAHAAHEWEGKKVMKKETSVSRWAGSRSTKYLFGVVDVRRDGTVFADSVPRWREPDMGEAFVRIFRKDGTVGSKIDRLSSLWQLDEDEAK